MNQIDPQILSRLDALAAKLGVGAGQAWQILLRQAKVEAASELFFLVIWAVSAFIFYRCCMVCVEKYKEEEGDWFMGIGLSIAAGVGSMIGVAACLSYIFGVLVNPEGYALGTILSALR